jgi:aspartate-semialdehyde dehydrogenase
MNAAKLKIAVFGATGLVGRTMLQIVEERGVACSQILPVASPKSRGLQIAFQGSTYTVSCPEDGDWRHADVVLLSAGAEVSRRWIPEIVASGIPCIDNSSAFRLRDNVPLVVPEVNPETLDHHQGIIANPNCSTIQLAVVSAPLHRQNRIEEIVVATYQSASGAGQKGILQLHAEAKDKTPDDAKFPHRLFDNLIPAIGETDERGFFSEERKLIHETRRILNAPGLKVFPTSVRVPITRCHGEAVHLVFEREIEPSQARKWLSEATGVRVLDSPEDLLYPLPVDCVNRDEVFVGRLRQIQGQKQTLDCWIVADNLRKGAALNAVQILELLRDKNLLK